MRSGHAAAARPYGSAQCLLGHAKPDRMILCWPGQAGCLHCVHWATHMDSAQWPRFEIKFLYLFLELFELVQTLKIHISLFVAPKIMKLVPLDL
jgi:hypothetical protein